MTKTLSNSLNMNPMPEEPPVQQLVAAGEVDNEQKIAEAHRDVEIVITQGLGAIKNTFADATDYSPRDKSRARQVAAELIRATVDAIKLKADVATKGIERSRDKPPTQNVSVSQNVYVDRNTLLDMLANPVQQD